jgi:hypothetical protein
MARMRQQDRAPESTLAPGAPKSRMGRTSSVVLIISVLSVMWALMMLTKAGQQAYASVFYFLEFYAGVFSLVLLSGTVVFGLVCTDRILLGIKHRVLFQTLHRFAGVGAIVFLVVHIWTKVSDTSASPLSIFIPFVNPYHALYVGMGTIASYLMFAVFASGVFRAKFQAKSSKWFWRGVHSLSYFSWPVAIMHGLTAGRPAATWVTASYVVCLLLVTLGLFFRLTVGKDTKGGFTGATATGTMKAIQLPITTTGSMAPVSRGFTPSTGTTGTQPALERGPARDEAEYDLIDAPAARGADRMTSTSERLTSTAERRRAGFADVEEDYARRTSGYALPAGRSSRRDGYDDEYDDYEAPYRPQRDEYRDQYREQYRDEYTDAPFDNGYVDLSDSPRITRHVTEAIPVQRERDRRSGRPARAERPERPERFDRTDTNVYGRSKAEEYEEYRRRNGLDRYVPDEDSGYSPRRSVEQQPSWQTSEQRPISGPPRHRLVEENSDSYVPTNARVPSPTYVGTARPRRAAEEGSLAPFDDVDPDDTPTLIDMASRRARRGARDSREYGEEAVPSSRRGRRRRAPEDAIDERYWVS